jgi:glycosyltransferase involved in cell wall biosynthesis
MTLSALTVLYIHASAPFGGASKSLCELLQAMPADSVNAVVLCPPGSAAERFRRAGAQVVTSRGVPQWDHTRYGSYRRMRWLLLLRELFFVLPMWLALLRVRKRIDRVDVVHANDITVLLVGALAARLLEAPLVVHVRSLQNDNAALWRTRWQNRLLQRMNANVIAIDETVRRTIPRWMDVSVIHNGLRVRENAPQEPRSDSEPRPFRAAIVGVLLRLKGVFDFVEAARLCRLRGIEAEFWIVGENVREVKGLRGQLLSTLGFAEDVRSGLSGLVQAYGLEGCVKFLGFVDDVASVYREIDVLCFPSHLDAAGRPVFEAAWFGVPSIVAVRDPLPDTIRDGQSGLCIGESDPQALADAIAKLYSDGAERHRLGRGARRLAETYFDQSRNSLQVLDIYRGLCERPQGSDYRGAARTRPLPKQRASVEGQAK